MIMPTNRMIIRGLTRGLSASDLQRMLQEEARERREREKILKNPERAKLKRCPFDGGKAVRNEIPGTLRFQIRCIKCACGTARYRNLGLAVIAWNRRVKE